MGQTKQKKRAKGAAFSQQGISLIIVLSFLGVLMGMVTEHTTNSSVNYVSSINARESMRTHFLNRSGANLAQMLIRVQTDLLDKNRKLIGDIQITEYAPMLLGMFGSSTADAKAIAEGFGGFSADAIEGLGVSAGQFDVQISSEDGKLNMNCANGSQSSRNNLQAQLEAMLYFDAYDPLFEKPDADGWQRTRSEQVSALMDYVDTDTTRAGQRGASEDYGYSGLEDRYKAKNNYLDTASEIKMIRGVDDRFWTLFGSQFTIYGDCKINLGAVKDTKLFASMIFLSAKNANDPVLQDPQRLWRLAQRVAEARNFGIFFDDLQAFADFVKDPNAAVAALASAGQDGITPTADPNALAEAQGLAPVEGVELDSQKLGQVASSGPRRLYRVEISSSIGVDAKGEPRFQRKLTGIWDTKVQNQNMRNRDYRQGSWVYWREE